MTMMTNTRFRTTLALSLAVALAACSRLSVVSDFDPEANFNAYETYEWLPDAKSEGSDIARDPLIDRRVRAAIERDLGAKGYRKVVDGGDFAIGYQLSTREEVSYSTMYSGWSGYGYHWGYWGPDIGVGSATTSRDVSTIGQLAIGVFDEGTRELVWYGTGEKTLSERQRSPEESQDEINDIVSRIMDSFPPGPTPASS